MLPERKASKGYHLMLRVMSEITGDPGAHVAKGTFVVSAKVNERLVIDKQKIECYFIRELNLVAISVYWEESGYKNYKEMGLFGKMDTKWQEVKRKGKWLYVVGNTYKVRIAL